MMEIQSVKIRRVGGEDDPDAEVVVEVQDWHGEWRELGREKLSGNFSSCWSLPDWRKGKRVEEPGGTMKAGFGGH